MCGIAGFSGGFDRGFLSKMNIIQKHRGPDDSGIWYDEQSGIGLAHTRLSIQDLSKAGHQPLISSDGSAVIVYNGEIYNASDLHDELVKDGYHFRGRSDTEVIMNLYLKLGVNLLSELNGIFSFAIWDKRKNELFVARDGLGVKPFYYTNSIDGFMFASEIKALLVNKNIDKSLNSKAVASHLTYLWSPSPETMLAGVHKLEPGHAIIVSDNEIKKKWCFYDQRYNDALYDISEGDAIEQCRHLVSQAVHRQLLSDVPLGAFLSGGLDSSAIVAFAKKHKIEQEFQAFTIDLQNLGGKSEGAIDDLPYARKVADFLGVDLKVIKVGSEIICDLEKMIYHLDEPQADPAALNVLYISKLAQENGIKVMLSGAGGDDIFTGYRRHYALLQERYWSWMPRNIRSMLSRGARTLADSNHTTRRLSKAFQYAGYEHTKRLASYFYWLNPDILYDVISPNLNAELSGYDVSSPMLATLGRLQGEIHPLNQLLYLETKHFLADHNLNYTDKMGMAEGVEIRVPLLDPDIVTFASGLPIHYKQRGRTGKWIFKKAMEGILPNDIIYRPKTGFGAPLRYWLRAELKELVDDVLSVDSLLKRNLFDPSGVQKLRKMDAEGKVDAAYPIFSMVCMELWCRIFLDRVNTSY